MKNAKFLFLTTTAVFALAFGMTSCKKEPNPVASPSAAVTPKPTVTAATTVMPTPEITVIPTVVPTTMPELIPTEMPENPTAVPTQTINPTAHK